MDKGSDDVSLMKIDLQDFADSCSSLTVRAVHNYWAKKAAASKLPLLQKFWYDKPWARLVDLTKLQHQDSSSDEEEGIPFQGKDSPQAQHHRKKAMDVQAVHDRLNHARCLHNSNVCAHGSHPRSFAVQHLTSDCVAATQGCSNLRHHDRLCHDLDLKLACSSLCSTLPSYEPLVSRSSRCSPWIPHQKTEDWAVCAVKAVFCSLPSYSEVQTCNSSLA